MSTVDLDARVRARLTPDGAHAWRVYRGMVEGDQRVGEDLTVEAPLWEIATAFAPFLLRGNPRLASRKLEVLD